MSDTIRRALEASRKAYDEQTLLINQEIERCYEDFGQLMDSGEFLPSGPNLSML
jgi:hypothetical protein